jgi:hypothetical protein
MQQPRKSMVMEYIYMNIFLPEKCCSDPDGWRRDRQPMLEAPVDQNRQEWQEDQAAISVRKSSGTP